MNYCFLDDGLLDSSAGEVPEIFASAVFLFYVYKILPLRHQTHEVGYRYKLALFPDIDTWVRSISPQVKNVREVGISAVKLV